MDMQEPFHILPNEPCPEVAAGKCQEECPELKNLRKIQKASGQVQAICKQCGRLIIISETRP